MKNITLISALALIAAVIFLFSRRSDPDLHETTEASQEAVTNPTNTLYTIGKKSPDGTGKFYCGREIAKVMGHPAIPWLERPERESEEHPSRALDLIELKGTEVIADIGAGSGYYTFRLAQKYPDARIVAVDIQEEMLGFLEQRIAQKNSQNIMTHHGKVDSIDLPKGELDAVLMVDAYHEFSHPHEMMSSIVSALKPGGQIYLIEYRSEDPLVEIKPLHKMSQNQAKKEMALVGLEWLKTIDDLPWQHFMVFRKP